MSSDDDIRGDLTPGQHALYQWAHLLVDFAAALMFVTGSIFFLYPAYQHAGTWLFLIGSIFFAMKPTIRLLRFLHVRRLAREAEQSVEALLQTHHLP
jgi:hypothetical protein